MCQATSNPNANEVTLKFAEELVGKSTLLIIQTKKKHTYQGENCGDVPQPAMIDYFREKKKSASGNRFEISDQAAALTLR